MGDSEWVEVRRKKPNSVFNRLKFPDHQSLANDLLKISTSVYVSNFPSHLTLLLHANVARFNRNVGVGQPNGPPKVSILKVVSINSSKVSTSHKEASYATVAKNLLGTGSKLDDRETNTPSIPIALHTPNDFPLALLGYSDAGIIGDDGQGADCQVKEAQEQMQDVSFSNPIDTPISPKIPPMDSDPFGLDPLINKALRKDSKSETPEFPPGYSPKCDAHASDSINNISSKEGVTQPSFSLLSRLEETIKVGFGP
ncbi:hypothetical protein Tco_1547738 [Tanacetum coccineum]